MDESRQIVPGVGIGPVHLADRIEAVVKVLGNPRSTGRSAGGTTYLWADISPVNGRAEKVMNGGLGVITDPQGVVVQVIAFYDGTYDLQGLPSTTIRDGKIQSVGSQEPEVLAAFGAPNRVKNTDQTRRFRAYYDEIGLCFGYDTSTVASTIYQNRSLQDWNAAIGVARQKRSVLSVSIVRRFQLLLTSPRVTV